MPLHLKIILKASENLDLQKLLTETNKIGVRCMKSKELNFIYAIQWPITMYAILSFRRNLGGK